MTGRRCHGSHELDSRAVGNCGRERRVASQESGVEDFGQREIDRVVRRDAVAELPDPRQKEVVRIANEGKGRKVFERLKPSGRVELT